MERVPANFYDEEYFRKGTKSNYAPYGPGDWADALVRMIAEYDDPNSVLDLGCATGLVVDRLNNIGIPSTGFDISEWAVNNAVTDSVYLGAVDDPESYTEADLITAFELSEHLTPEQAHDMFVLARENGNRMLCIIAAFRDGEEEVEPQHEKDKSHINLKPMGWWRALAEANGWSVLNASDFDEDPISQKMGWSGRFLYLSAE